MNAVTPNYKTLVESSDVAKSTEKVLIFRVSNQPFGIPALTIQDIIGPQSIARIPLAPAFIAGALNLRGRIVTAIDLHNVLALGPSDHAKRLNIVVRACGELYDLCVDDVGDVVEMSLNELEPNPSTWPEAWRRLSNGIFKLKDELTVILNVEQLINQQIK